MRHLHRVKTNMQYENDSGSLKTFLFWSYCIFHALREKGGNFKTKKLFNYPESFLYCLYSRIVSTLKPTFDSNRPFGLIAVTFGRLVIFSLKDDTSTASKNSFHLPARGQNSNYLRGSLVFKMVFQYTYQPPPWNMDL